MSTITVSTTLWTRVCPDCGGLYAIAQEFVDEARRIGDFKKCWSCPYCKSERGFGEDEMGKLKREIQEKENSRLAAIQSREAALIREKNALAEAEHFRKKSVRIHKRAAAGVCPCCKRTVAQMARHMKTKHPHFVATA